MIKEYYKNYLQELAKHTNKIAPYCRYIGANVFPEQISELLNTEVTLKYRTHYKIEMMDDEPSSRPSDDDPFIHINPEGPEFIDPHDIYEDQFIVVRADRTEPYRFIAMAKDYSKFLVNSTKKDDNDEYLFNSTVSLYPLQNDRLIGFMVQDEWEGEITNMNAVTLRVDDCEPAYSVLMEFLGSSGVVRFLIGDEIKANIVDTYVSIDYDNKDASEHEDPIDVDGTHADNDGLDEETFTNIDGGFANNLQISLNPNNVRLELSDKERIQFIESVMEDVVIYGSVQDSETK